MSRPCRARAPWMFVLVLAAGCQSYNFNPVGHCLIQPGGKQYTLSSISTADVLFVVDDSGSMSAEQQRLAANFSAFINNLDTTNAARASAGLDPIDFHIAVTTTSVFWNYQTATTCRNDCSDAAGSLVCCVNSTNKAARQPQSCTTPGSTAGCPAGTTCSTSCNGLRGESYCCDPTTGTFPAGSLAATIPCSNAGGTCGTFQRHFPESASGCDLGVASGGYAYAHGDFVSWSDPAGGAAVNPRVLHFDKSLYPLPASATATRNRPCSSVANCAPTGEVCVAATSAVAAPKFCRATCTGTCTTGYTCVSNACQPTNGQGFTSQQLVNFFAGNPAGTNANVKVGTCGSGEEQGLEGARLALQKALASQQKDTYGASGTVAWNPATRVASAGATWPHPNSKLVLVFIGDEDDCSSPEDPSGGVVMDTGEPGNDACVHDGGAKEYDVATRFVDYFTSLGRPVGAAFIESAAQTQCGYSSGGVDYGACTPGVCCEVNCATALPGDPVCSSSTVTYCGGQAAGSRMFAAADQLRERGSDVVKGSICDGSFDKLLNQIAEIVKPPSGLELPTTPASDAITVLRIARPDGTTRRLCGRPAPGGMTQVAAADAGYEWWFTATKDPGGSVAVSRFVYINPASDCVANPGETYSAEYIGKLPEAGCGYDASSGETGDQMCQRLLGGAADSWTCYAPGTAGTCGTTTFDPGSMTGNGTCICGSRQENCP